MLGPSISHPVFDFLDLGRIGRAKRALRSIVATAARGRRPYGLIQTSKRPNIQTFRAGAWKMIY